MSFLLIMTLVFFIVVALDFAEKKRQSSAR
jgi:hypothetical protein